MESDIALFEKLLKEESSDMLFFRPRGYQFQGASNVEKSELLRDIIGFANAWRRADAYIITGVKEVKNGENEILGIIDHLNFDEIQEFVNSKTQNPIQFSYNALTVNRKKIGMIHIPLQSRPFFLQNDYVNLKKYVVYVHRGESVVEAGPDEVTKMKISDSQKKFEQPSFALEFAHSNKKSSIGSRINLKTFLIEVPQEDLIPDFNEDLMVNPLSATGKTLTPTEINKNYYRELIDHYQQMGSVSLIDFCIHNNSDVDSENVRLAFSVGDKEGIIFFMEEFELIPKPRKYKWEGSHIENFLEITPGLKIEKKSSEWQIGLFLGQIPPKQKLFTTSGLYVGAKKNVVLDIDVNLLADNLFEPLVFPLIIDIKTQMKKLQLEMLLKSKSKIQ
jgi:hypothetical protein